MTEPAAPSQVPPVSNKKKGLSIVSALAVVAGIVLCMGAVAAPKFGSFSCKAKQSEAKTNLSGINTAERAFKAEYGYFTTDLVSLQWKPDGSPIYAYGFSSPSSAGPDPDVPELDPTRRATVDPRVVGTMNVARMKASDGRAFNDEDFQRSVPAATASTSAFLVVAIGNIDSDEALDVWTIDQERNLNIVTNDCHL